MNLNDNNDKNRAVNIVFENIKNTEIGKEYKSSKDVVLRYKKNNKHTTLKEAMNTYKQVGSSMELNQWIGSQYDVLTPKKAKSILDSKGNKGYNNKGLNKDQELNKNNNPLYNKKLNSEIKNIQELIQKGTFTEESFIKHKDNFDKRINGIATSIGKKIYNPENRYFHIVSRHQEMSGPKRTKNIIETFKEPDNIENKSINGETTLIFYKEINNEKFKVVTREYEDDLKIITAYIPKDKNYNGD